MVPQDEFDEALAEVRRLTFRETQQDTMQFITILKFIITLLPLLIEAIKALEAAIPGKGKGEQKLITIRTAIESVYGLTNEGLPKFEVLWPAIKKTIDGIVGVFNSTGIFKKE